MKGEGECVCVCVEGGQLGGRGGRERGGEGSERARVEGV